jgi:hypothetical protein
MKGEFCEYYINNLYTTHAVVSWVTAAGLRLCAGLEEEDGGHMGSGDG